MTFQVLHKPDSFQVLKALPDKSVDVIITDPPYAEHTQAKHLVAELVRTE